jgi:hypothetical protein
VEVLDAQIHLNHIHPEWKTAQIEDILAAALAAMDAVGVDGLVVSEFWGLMDAGARSCQMAPFGRNTRSRSWPHRRNPAASSITRW